MTLQDMFRTIWFGKWLVLVSVLAALGGAWLYVDRQEPQYASQAVVQLVDAETLTTAGVRLESDPSLTTSDAVTAAAATALGDPALAGGLAGGTSGEYAADNPNNVVITATGLDPDGTVDSANAIATAYVAALQAQFDDDVASMQKRLDDLAANIDEQQQAITETRRAAADAAAAASAGTGTTVQVEPVEGLLEAQYSTTMDQYQTLSGQLTQAQLLAAPATILQNAVHGTLVSIPPLLIYAVAALAGLLIGIGLAVVRRGLDNKVRTTGSARRSAGAPVLARLSGTAAALKSFEAEGTLPVARREATTYTRSVRELRTALQAAVENDSGSAVIVVTAADVETPRSFVAANLAASWALSGRSVVVLSGDLRQPRLNALLPATADAPARRGGNRARTAALPTAIPHLSVHPALQTELDPADYLASDEVRALVEQLRRTEDVVIIDAPPMLVAADATILGSYADGVLLAVTLGHTAIGAVEESADRLRAANAALLGLSLDGAAERRHVSYEATYAYAGATESEDAGGEAPADARADRAGSRAAPTPAGADASTPAADGGAPGAEPDGTDAPGAQTPAAEARGEQTQGDQAQGDQAQGDQAQGDEPQGDEPQGDADAASSGTASSGTAPDAAAPDADAAAAPPADGSRPGDVPAPHGDVLPEDQTGAARPRKGRAPVAVETS